MNRAAAAAELQLQEIARLRDAIVPRIETLRGMSLSAFRSVIALTLERLGHHIVTDPTAPDLVTTKLTDKFITECAPPATLTPISLVALRRLHDVVVATGASRGFLITTHSFTADAEKYAEGAPLDLIDGRRLIKNSQSEPQTRSIAATLQSAVRPMRRHRRTQARSRRSPPLP